MKIPQNSIFTLLKSKTIYRLELWQLCQIIGEYIDVKSENIEIKIVSEDNGKKIILEVNNERI